MNKCCFNCRFCSEYYPKFVDVCDKDGHIIENADKEMCEWFAPSEVDE